MADGWSDEEALLATCVYIDLNPVAAGLLEESRWLCPLEDLRSKGSVREGMLPGFSLGSYLLLLDYSSRLVRQGKARVSPEVAGIFDRLGSSPEIWNHRLRTMLDKSRLLGVYFTTNRDRLREIAAQRGKHHLDNAAPIDSKATLGSAT